MCAEYDPIGLFERNSCFRVNTLTPSPESGLRERFHASGMRFLSKRFDFWAKMDAFLAKIEILLLFLNILTFLELEIIILI